MRGPSRGQFPLQNPWVSINFATQRMAIALGNCPPRTVVPLIILFTLHLVFHRILCSAQPFDSYSLLTNGMGNEGSPEWMVKTAGTLLGKHRD